MGDRIIDFLYRVRGDFSPNGLPKVFFSFYPEDMDQMVKIADDILDISNCAVWYHEDSMAADDIDLDDLGMKLQEMKLFVVIISTNYLANDSLAKNWEYGFAMEHHIPVLPIAVESGLEEYFAVEMNCIHDGYGDIQLLKSEVTDWTEISYYQKLARDLGAILLENEEVERIKQAFSGKIFLSYRKKDRKYANELMHTIHSIPSLRNVSIWFDEFISAGEKWSDQIGDALKQSDVFLLLVSPSITEPDNYVIREEYPSAKNQGKTIVSAGKNGDKTEAPDIEELRQIFPGLRVLVDGDDADELENALQEITSEAESTPEKDFLIGLAFFNGIDMERDTEKAVPLIVASARQNLPEAVKKLAEMYWKGDGIAVNYENSILWRKRLVDIYERKFDEIKDPEEMLKYIQRITPPLLSVTHLLMNRPYRRVTAHIIFKHSFCILLGIPRDLRSKRFFFQIPPFCLETGEISHGKWFYRLLVIRLHTLYQLPVRFLQCDLRHIIKFHISFPVHPVKLCFPVFRITRSPGADFRSLCLHRGISPPVHHPVWKIHTVHLLNLFRTEESVRNKFLLFHILQENLFRFFPVDCKRNDLLRKIFPGNSSR